jgi:hypothetical protein
MPKAAIKKPIVKTPKSRSNNPILATLESLKGYPPSLKIYKIPASHFYWVRYYDGIRITRSTKTTNKTEAIKFSKEFFNQLLYNKINGINHIKAKKLTTFMQCVEGVIKEDELAARRDEFSESYAKTQKQVLRKYIADFFKDYAIEDIDYPALNSFKSYLYDKDLKTATIKVQFAGLNKIFKYAEIHKFIKTRPHFPKIKQEDDARPPFNEREYILLRKTARSLVDKTFELRAESGKKLRNVGITEEISWLIGFMAYAFIRPTDIKTIQHKHLEIRQKQYSYLWMPIPETKRHGKAIVSMPKAVYFYNKIIELRQKQGIAIKPDDYLFQPQHLNRVTAYRNLARQFDIILEAANLKIGDKGINRSIYSMRHTSLLFAAKRNTSISRDALASNARTSTLMLEKHYLSTLENEDLANALHARDSHKKVK